MRICIVYDNQTFKEDFRRGYGFGALVEVSGKTILFDTGGTDPGFFSNLEKAGASPGKIDILFISHDHWDHTGSMEALMQRNGNLEVFLPASFGKGKAGASSSRGRKFHFVKDPCVIAEGVYSTGELEGPVREQSMTVESALGPVLLTGCAHPGICEIAAKAKEITKRDIHLALGGFHLMYMNEEEVTEIALRLKKIPVSRVAPSHCSGPMALGVFRKIYGKDCILSGAGKEWIF